MFYFLSLIWILSISGLLVIVLKKKFGFVCTITFLLGSLVLYVFGFINRISWGFYLTWGLVLLFFCIIFKWIINKDKVKLNEFKNNYLTFGLFGFVTLCAYSFILFKKQGFTYCDEFTHWGPMVIATIKANGFYAVPDSLLTFHKDYPPLFSLLEVLWCGFDKFNYSETYCYIALSTFMFSGFLPIFEKLSINNKKDWIKSLIIIVSIVLVGITISKTFTAQEYAFVYNSIYTDWSLALFCAYSLFMVYKEKEWNFFGYFFLCICLVSFLLMKQMGICFYLMVLFYAFIKILFIDKKLNIKRLLKGIAFFLIIPFIAYFSWQYIIDFYELQGQFVISNFKFSEVLNIARGDTEYPWKQEAYANFLYSIINRPLVLHPFKLSYFVYVGLIIAFITIIFKAKKEGWLISLTYLIGACGYALTMLLLYMLAYDIYEAPRLASFDRYMNTYLYVGTVLALLLAYDIFADYKGKSEYISFGLVFIILCLFIEPGSIKTIIPRLKVEDENRKVLVVKQYNHFHPTREDLNGLRLEFNDLGYIDNNKMSYEKWTTLLDSHEFLYVVGYDDYIYKELWKPLNQEVYLWNDSLYVINKEGNNYKIDYQMEQYFDYVMNYYLMEK